jgi:hypothetical protein
MSPDENVDATLGMIEGVNSMADAMTAMKSALEQRGWSTPMSEQVGAQFGSALFAMMPQQGRRR